MAYRRPRSWVLVLSTAFIAVLSSSSAFAQSQPGASQVYFQPPAEADIPDDRLGAQIRLGANIFSDTRKFAPRYAGRAMSCSDCHLNNGRQPNAAPMWAAVLVYPRYRLRSDRVESIEDRVRSCFIRGMNGIAPPPNAPELRALVAYFHFLAQGAPLGVSMPGRGFSSVPKTPKDPSSERGAKVYTSFCEHCHSDPGQPALFGWKSYNKGSLFMDTGVLAGFVWGAHLSGAKLTPQQTKDVAAWINVHERPPDPTKGLLEGLFAR